MHLRTSAPGFGPTIDVCPLLCCAVVAKACSRCGDTKPAAEFNANKVCYWRLASSALIGMLRGPATSMLKARIGGTRPAGLSDWLLRCNATVAAVLPSYVAASADAMQWQTRMCLVWPLSLLVVDSAGGTRWAVLVLQAVQCSGSVGAAREAPRGGVCDGGLQSLLTLPTGVLCPGALNVRMEPYATLSPLRCTFLKLGSAGYFMGLLCWCRASWRASSTARARTRMGCLGSAARAAPKQC